MCLLKLLIPKNQVGNLFVYLEFKQVPMCFVGAPKVQLSKAMLHLQRLTDSGAEVEPDVPAKPDYSFEQQPVEWIEGSPEENYSFISEIARYYQNFLLKVTPTTNVFQWSFLYSSESIG